MISEEKAREYCCEDISLIRGYERAVNDTTQLYELHHLEGVFYSIDEMKRLGKYFKQPAEALIFLTRSEHKKIHYAFNPVSDERKDKISKAKAKPVFQYTLDGIFMNEWPSIKEVVKTLGFGYSNISACCRGECISSNGYIWSYEKKDHLVPMKNEWIKQVGQYTLDGSLVKVWPSIKEAESQIGTTQGCICKCCKGKQRSAYGFVWRYYTGPESEQNIGKTAAGSAKAVCQYSLDGKFIRELPSAAEAGRLLGHLAGHICQCCNGKRKQAYGYIWRYAE